MSSPWRVQDNAGPDYILQQKRALQVGNSTAASQQSGFHSSLQQKADHQSSVLGFGHAGVQAFCLPAL